MKKIAVLAMILGIIVSMTGFAKGIVEDESGVSAYEAQEPVSIKGALAYNDEGYPLIRTTEATYRLVFNYALAYGLDVSEGDRIAAEGYVVPGPNNPVGTEDPEYKYLAVNRVEIGDTVYLIPHQGRMGGGISTMGSAPAWKHGADPRAVAPRFSDEDEVFSRQNPMNRSRAAAPGKGRR